MSANTKGKPVLLVREINSAEVKDHLERKKDRKVMQKKLAHFSDLAAASHTVTGMHSALSTALHLFQSNSALVLHHRSHVQ